MIYWGSFFFVLIVGFILEYFVFNRKWLRFAAISAIALLMLGIVVGIDFYARTADTEVWSGRIVDAQHKEEYDEWHPESCTTSTDDKGRTTRSCTPGYWEHHDAENHIKTTDNGWFSVSRSMDGEVRFNDSFPNRTAELAKFFPEGTPSASTHTYVNKVQASYSIFKNKGIDPKDYPGLPKYPENVENYVSVPRFVGDIPDKDAIIDKLDEWNAELNKPVPDPDKPGKTKPWKEVNLIFVNVGEDKPREYGLALQDSWQNGNKNDFTVSFSLNKDGTVAWAYAFSWSEVDILKLEVQDILMGSGKITDFAPIVDKVANLVSEKFVRKQFADFNYIQIELSGVSTGILWIMQFLLLAVHGVLAYQEKTTGRYPWNRRRYRTGIHLKR
jgi:hypothetical protein